MGIRTAWLSAAATLVVSASAGHAQVPVGTRMTIGEMYARDIAQIATDVGEYAGAKAAMGQELAQARQAFFASLNNPAQRKTAEARFARLLYGKDLTLMLQQVSEGPTERNQSIQAGLALISGGQLDGGIPYNAEPYFHLWLQGVRISLGARRPGTMVVPASTQALAQAIAANRETYERYKAQRDLAEFARHQGTPAAVRKLAPDASLPLSWQEFVGPEAAAYNTAFAPTQDAYDALLEAGRNDPKALMRCVYGPSVSDSQDAPAVSLYSTYFWHARLPANFDRIQAADQARGAFQDLGTEALQRCPASSKAANAFVEAARKAYQARRPATASQPSPQETTAQAQRQFKEVQALRERHNQERNAMSATFNQRMKAVTRTKSAAGNPARDALREAQRKATAELRERHRRELEEIQQRHRREAGR